MNYGRVLGGGDHCLLFTPALAAAAMTMLVARTEQTFEVVTFAKELTPVKIDANMSLDDIKGRLFEVSCVEIKIQFFLVFFQFKNLFYQLLLL